MEVVTIFTSSKQVLQLFDTFIYSFPTLQLTSKGSDTTYFDSTVHHKGRLFYHYELNDVENEFSYNYLEEDITAIRNHYKGREFYMFDMSYRPEDMLMEIFKAFKSYMKMNAPELLNDILISHPFDGLKVFEKEY